jgi:hypothetical protein
MHCTHEITKVLIALSSTASMVAAACIMSCQCCVVLAVCWLQLSEFSPHNPGLLGLNVNRGAEVKIRLRPARDDNSFYDWNHILGTMLHEVGQALMLLLTDMCSMLYPRTRSAPTPGNRCFMFLSRTSAVPAGSLRGTSRPFAAIPIACNGDMTGVGGKREWAWETRTGLPCRHCGMVSCAGLDPLA